MKIINQFAYCITAALILCACKKGIIKPLPLTSINSSQTQIKIVYASPYTTNYSVQLKVNDTRVSNNITYSTPFPGGGLNTGGGNYSEYIIVNPGTLKLGVSIPNYQSNSDSIPLSSNSVNVDPGKNYSIYLADTAANTQAIVVQDNLALVVGDFSRYKFVNTIPNSTGIDLYFDTVLVASNIPYQGVSPEFNLVRGNIGFWTMHKAGAGITSDTLAIYPTVKSGKQTVPNGRVMTVYSRGYLSGSGNKATAISMLYNF